MLLEEMSSCIRTQRSLTQTAGVVVTSMHLLSCPLALGPDHAMVMLYSKNSIVLNNTLLDLTVTSCAGRSQIR